MRNLLIALFLWSLLALAEPSLAFGVSSGALTCILVGSLALLVLDGDRRRPPPGYGT